MKVTDKIEITNEDNMLLMARYPDNYFDLAIVDPPYGIGEDGRKGVRTSPSRPNSYNRKPKYTSKNWDNSAPSKDYFIELLRVSKYVIIWGANHFIENIPLPDPPLGFSDIVSSFKITALLFAEVLNECIKYPIVVCSDISLCS